MNITNVLYGWKKDYDFQILSAMNNADRFWNDQIKREHAKD